MQMPFGFSRATNLPAISRPLDRLGTSGRRRRYRVGPGQLPQPRCGSALMLRCALTPVAHMAAHSLSGTNGRGHRRWCFALVVVTSLSNQRATSSTPSSPDGLEPRRVSDRGPSSPAWRSCACLRDGRSIGSASFAARRCRTTSLKVSTSASAMIAAFRRPCGLAELGRSHAHRSCEHVREHECVLVTHHIGNHLDRMVR